MRFPAELRNRPGNPLWFNWRTDFRFPIFQPGGARNFNHTDGGFPPGYYREGFLIFQHAIFKAFAFFKAQAYNFDILQLPNVMVNVRLISRIVRLCF